MQKLLLITLTALMAAPAVHAASVTSAPEVLDRSTSARVQIDAVDGSCRLDEGPWTDCEGAVYLNELTSGPHELQVHDVASTESVRWYSVRPSSERLSDDREIAVSDVRFAPAGDGSTLVAGSADGRVLVGELTDSGEMSGAVDVGAGEPAQLVQTRNGDVVVLLASGDLAGVRSGRVLWRSAGAWDFIAPSAGGLTAVMRSGETAEFDEAGEMSPLRQLTVFSLTSVHIDDMVIDPSLATMTLIGSGTDTDGDEHSFVARMLAGGQADESFGQAGRLLDVGMIEGEAEQWLAGADGEGVVTMRAANTLAARFEDGVPDASYARPELEERTQAWSVREASGHLYTVKLMEGAEGMQRLVVVRYEADGERDERFDTLHVAMSKDLEMHDVLLSPDGQLLIGYSDDAQPRLARFGL